MIASFRSKALKLYWEKGNPKRLPADQLPRIKRRLEVLDTAREPEDMNLPGFYFHALTGASQGRYSVRVSGNWRITFAFEDEDAVDVDYEDYH